MTIPAAGRACGDADYSVAPSARSKRTVAFIRQLAGQGDQDSLLAEIVAAAVSEIDAAQHAGIAVVRTGGALASVCSDDLARELDRYQRATGEGPALSAATEPSSVVRTDDLRSDRRWPQLGAAAAHLDVRSALCFHLYTMAEGGIDTIGTLSVYAAAPAAFSDDSVRAGLLVAGQAAVAAAAAERAAQLRTALQSRDVIGQAKGILMERFKITAEHAFELLVTASQHGNGKLRDVADRLAATGEMAIPDCVYSSLRYRATSTTACATARWTNSPS